jgi:hypothetical protein
MRIVLTVMNAPWTWRIKMRDESFRETIVVAVGVARSWLYDAGKVEEDGMP